MSSKLKLHSRNTVDPQLLKYNELLGDITSDPEKYQLCKIPASEMDRNDLLVAFAYFTHLWAGDVTKPQNYKEKNT